MAALKEVEDRQEAAYSMVKTQTNSGQLSLPSQWSLLMVHQDLIYEKKMPGNFREKAWLLEVKIRAAHRGAQFIDEWLDTWLKLDQHDS